MLFHEDGPADGPENMARDWALLEGLEDEGIACRTYIWNGAWVSLGRFQNPATDVAPGFERWVLRPTGGKAVLHGHDRTVGIAMRFDRELGVKDAYVRATSPLVAALRACGLDAALVCDPGRAIESLPGSTAAKAACSSAVLKHRTPEALKHRAPEALKHRAPEALKHRTPEALRHRAPGADCFAATSLYDIVDARSGVKVCGCALRVLRDRVLLQASVPYGDALIDPETAIVGAVALPVFEWDHSRFPSAMREACATMFSRR